MTVEDNNNNSTMTEHEVTRQETTKPATAIKDKEATSNNNIRAPHTRSRWTCRVLPSTED